MRIIAGAAKGRRLRTLKGRALRPTADRVREALFSMLRDRVHGARFLDLFAGAGAVGLEALSRGAAQAVFVESHPPAARLIEENAALCGFSAQARILALPVARALDRLARETAQFELVFADPPYDTGQAQSTLSQLARRCALCAPGGLLICQHSRREELPQRMGLLGRMRLTVFGETILDVYQCGGGIASSLASRQEGVQP